MQKLDVTWAPDENRRYVVALYPGYPLYLAYVFHVPFTGSSRFAWKMVSTAQDFGILTLNKIITEFLWVLFLSKYT